MPGLKKHSRLQDVVAVATIGDRPFAQRALSRAVLPAALVAMVALGTAVSPTASAQYYAPPVNTSARVYRDNQALNPAQVEEGRVVAVRQVELQNTRNTAGAVIGGAIGASVGYATMARGHHYYASGIASMIGGLVGSVAGARVEGSMARHRQAVEVFVDIGQNGYHRVVASVQDNDQPGIYPGAEVLVTRGNGGFRVIPANGADMPQQGPQPSGYYRQPAAQPSAGYTQPGVTYSSRPRW